MRPVPDMTIDRTAMPGFNAQMSRLWGIGSGNDQKAAEIAQHLFDAI